MFIWEIFPAYVFPLLNGINIFCLATQHVPGGAQDVITNLFGGTDGNEGLGFMSLSLDWQYITSVYMSFPLIQQGADARSICSRLLEIDAVCSQLTRGSGMRCATSPSWASTTRTCGTCVLFSPSLLGRPSWCSRAQSKAFPMLSTSLYSQSGKRYNQTAIFGTTFTLNQTALEEIGLPALTGMCDIQQLWQQLCSSCAHCPYPYRFECVG